MMKGASKAILLLLLSLFLAGCTHKTAPQEPEPKPKDIAKEDLPYTELLPHADGHRLDISISGIKVSRMDYQVVYTGFVKNNPVERGFGARDVKITDGTLVRNGQNAVVFGSESSGKFKYDEGVEKGSIEITYRDTKGKAVGRAVSQWYLQDSSKATKITSPDGKLVFTPAPKTKAMFLVMNSLGLPSPVPGNVIAGPYALLSSSAKASGTVSLTDAPANASLMYFDKSAKTWKEVKSTINLPAVIILITSE